MRIKPFGFTEITVLLNTGLSLALLVLAFLGTDPELMALGAVWLALNILAVGEIVIFNLGRWFK